MADPVRLSHGWGERTVADLSSLLVELSRAQKALAFYSHEHRASQDLLDRAFLAWQGDLERGGPLDLSIDALGFRAAGVTEAISRSHLEALADALTRRGVSRLQIDRDVSREAFHNFVRLLSEPPPSPRTDEAEGHCAFSRELYTRGHHGITVNGEPDTTASSTGPATTQKSGGPEDSASLGSALLVTRPPVVYPDTGEAKLTIDENPLEAPASSEAASELTHNLRQLDCCSEDAGYERLAAQVVALANELAAQGAVDEAFRAPLVLAGHAVGEGGRSGLQARVAQAALRELAEAGRLSEIIDRACSPSPGRSVRAAQVLLQLGEAAVPAILERLEQESNSEAAAQLAAVTLALGEPAVPTLVLQMAEGPEVRRLLAVRLAGELQSPALVAPLRNLLCGGASQLSLQAGKALAQIGNSQAVQALVEALSNARIEVAERAAMCLGGLRDPRTLPPLLAALERARKEKRISLARQIIRALGQFERAGDAAVSALAKVLERRTPPWRRAERQLKLEVVRALGQLPGREARHALRGAARSRNAHLRRCAQRTLARRARAGIDCAR